MNNYVGEDLSRRSVSQLPVGAGRPPTPRNIILPTHVLSSRTLVQIDSDGEVTVGAMTMPEAITVIRQLAKALHECQCNSKNTDSATPCRDAYADFLSME